MTIQTEKNQQFPGVNDISPKEASEYLSQPTVTWIDVRSNEEYIGELSHIKNSILIPMDQISNQLSKIPKSGIKIFICRSGQRSAKTCQYLQGIGYTDCFNLGGGMLLWNQLQLPVEGK
jgi:rhodanese-related sulfurtransferase